MDKLQLFAFQMIHKAFTSLDFFFIIVKAMYALAVNYRI